MVRRHAQMAAAARCPTASCLGTPHSDDNTRYASSIATTDSVTNLGQIRSFQFQNRGLVSSTRTTYQPSALAQIRWFSDDSKEDKKDGDAGEDAAPPPKSEAKEEKVEEKEPEKPKKEAKKEEKPPAEEKNEEKPAKADAPSDEATSDDKPAAPAEDDEVPNWQNPLHHNNPEKQKIFEEDFPPGEMPVQELPPFEDPNDPEKVLASKEIYDLADEVVGLSMLEMNELVNKLATHFGFEKPPFHGSDGSGGGGDDDGDDEGGAAAEPEKEKTAFDLKLVSYDDKAKIKVIKEVRAIAGLGLKEAKEMVEGAPKVVMKDIGKDAAEEMKKKLEEIGAVVEIV